LIEEKGGSQQKAAEYFNKGRSWNSHHVNIANNLNTTLVTAGTTLSYRSARELAKLSPNKQEQAFRLARKMARHDRKVYHSSKVMAKVVKKTREKPTEPDSNGNGSDPEENRWLKPTTLWNFGSCDPRFGFRFPGRIPGQVVLYKSRKMLTAQERMA
jgi:hypothetical protein